MSILISEINKKINSFSNIKENIRLLRNTEGITLNILSRNLGINFNKFKEYEFGDNTPPLDIAVKIADYFGVSLDFFILGTNTNYPHSIRFLKLVEKIDKLNFNERYKIEGTTSTLIGIDNINNELEIKLDYNNFNLSNDIHSNIKLLRQMKQFSQKQLAELLLINQSQITFYENGKSSPPIDKLIKLSEIFNISIHSLATGQRLNFNLENKGLQNITFKADQLLSLEHKKFLIDLMQKIIDDSSP